MKLNDLAFVLPLPWHRVDRQLSQPRRALAAAAPVDTHDGIRVALARRLKAMALVALAIVPCAVTAGCQPYVVYQTTAAGRAYLSRGDDVYECHGTTDGPRCWRIAADEGGR